MHGSRLPAMIQMGRDIVFLGELAVGNGRPDLPTAPGIGLETNTDGGS